MLQLYFGLGSGQVGVLIALVNHFRVFHLRRIETEGRRGGGLLLLGAEIDQLPTSRQSGYLNLGREFEFLRQSLESPLMADRVVTGEHH
jgi:hypothetical protein